MSVSSAAPTPRVISSSGSSVRPIVCLSNHDLARLHKTLRTSTTLFFISPLAPDVLRNALGQSSTDPHAFNAWTSTWVDVDTLVESEQSVSTLVRCKATGQRAVRKTIRMDVPHARPRADVIQEIEIMAALSGVHTHIASLFAVYEDDVGIHIVMSPYKSTLAEFIGMQEGKLAESYIAHTLIRPLISVLDHVLTNHDVLFRDLRLQTVMLKADPQGRQSVQLCDFSEAVGISKATSVVGEPYALAPELMQILALGKTEGAYTDRIITWSLGVLVYEIFAGQEPPWHGAESPEEMLEAVLDYDVDEDAQLTEMASPEAVDFIKYCLERDPSKRPPISVMDEHPFIVLSSNPSITPDNIHLHKHIVGTEYDDPAPRYSAPRPKPTTPTMGKRTRFSIEAEPVTPSFKPGTWNWEELVEKHQKAAQEEMERSAHGIGPQTRATATTPTRRVSPVPVGRLDSQSSFRNPYRPQTHQFAAYNRAPSVGSENGVTNRKGSASSFRSRTAATANGLELQMPGMYAQPGIGSPVAMSPLAMQFAMMSQMQQAQAQQYQAMMVMQAQGGLVSPTYAAAAGNPAMMNVMAARSFVKRGPSDNGASNHPGLGNIGQAHSANALHNLRSYENLPTVSMGSPRTAPRAVSMGGPGQRGRGSDSRDEDDDEVSELMNDKHASTPPPADTLKLSGNNHPSLNPVMEDDVEEVGPMQIRVDLNAPKSSDSGVRRQTPLNSPTVGSTTMQSALKALQEPNASLEDAYKEVTLASVQKNQPVASAPASSSSGREVAGKNDTPLLTKYGKNKPSDTAPDFKTKGTPTASGRPAMPALHVQETQATATATKPPKRTSFFSACFCFRQSAADH